MFPALPRRRAARATAPVLVLAAMLLAGCAARPGATRDVPAPDAVSTPAPPVVAEHWTGAPRPDDELDSIAAWTGPDGEHWLVASAKSTDRLVVFDAGSGAVLREVGRRGQAPGEFHRPNGLAVFGDLLFVVERDNRRVQMLRLPDLAPVGAFGAPDLRSPYGIWLHETAPGELEAYVTDSFMDGAKFDVVPPLGQLDRRVRRYRIAVDGESASAPAVTALGHFGDTSPGGALHMVESLAGDPAHGRLLVADEFRGNGGSTLRDYTLDGRWTGGGIPAGTFDGEAEGVVLWSCRGDGGYWLAVDQKSPLTVFHLFDRASLAPRGRFTGEVTALTDGIALDAAASDHFPHGALYAVHQDRTVVAFDLGAVVRALDLDPACLE